MDTLAIAKTFQGSRDKLQAYEVLKRNLALEDAAIAYVGDDVVDLPVMRRVGLAIAVADAHHLVQGHAHLCTRLPGGRGAAREVCELIMEAQGTLAGMLAHER